MSIDGKQHGTKASHRHMKREMDEEWETHKSISVGKLLLSPEITAILLELLFFVRPVIKVTSASSVTIHVFLFSIFIDFLASRLQRLKISA